jgi:hypothetical protein
MKTRTYFIPAGSHAKNIMLQVRKEQEENDISR